MSRKIFKGFYCLAIMLITLGALCFIPFNKSDSALSADIVETNSNDEEPSQTVGLDSESLDPDLSGRKKLEDVFAAASGYEPTLNTVRRPEGDFYIIDTADKLAYVAYQISINNSSAYAGYNYEVQKDIDLSSYIWTPIGTSKTPFKGIFHGGRHKISGVKVTSTSTATSDSDRYIYMGLFGYVSGTSSSKLAVISDVILEDYFCVSDGALAYIGALVGYMYSNAMVVNCYDKSDSLQTTIGRVGTVSATYVYWGGSEDGSTASYTTRASIQSTVTYYGTLESTGYVIQYKGFDTNYLYNGSGTKVSQPFYQTLVNTSGIVQRSGYANYAGLLKTRASHSSSEYYLMRKGYAFTLSPNSTSPSSLYSTGMLISITWATSKLTITRDYGYAGRTDTVQVDNDSTWAEAISSISAPTRTGYTLKGYYTTSSRTTQVSGYVSAGTVYLDWTAKTNIGYNVDLVNVSGDTFEAKNAVTGLSITDSGASSKAGTTYDYDIANHTAGNNITISFTLNEGYNFGTKTNDVSTSKPTLSSAGVYLVFASGQYDTFTPVSATTTNTGTSYTVTISNLLGSGQIYLVFSRVEYSINLTGANVSWSLSGQSSATSISGTTLKTKVGENFVVTATANSGMYITVVNQKGFTSVSGANSGTPSGSYYPSYKWTVTNFVSTSTTREFSATAETLKATINVSIKHTIPECYNSHNPAKATAGAVGTDSTTNSETALALVVDLTTSNSATVFMTPNAYYTYASHTLDGGQALTDASSKNGRFEVMVSNLSKDEVRTVVFTAKAKSYNIKAVKVMLGSAEMTSAQLTKYFTTQPTSSKNTLNPYDTTSLNFAFKTNDLVFAGWSVSSGTLNSANANPATLTMGTDDITVTANFNYKNAKFNLSTGEIRVIGFNGGTSDATYSASNVATFKNAAGSAITSSSTSRNSDGDLIISGDVSSVSITTGYYFLGWYLKNDSTYTKLTDSKKASLVELLSNSNIISAINSSSSETITITLVAAVKQKTISFTFASDDNDLTSIKDSSKASTGIYYYAQEDSIFGSKTFPFSAYSGRYQKIGSTQSGWTVKSGFATGNKTLTDLFTKSTISTWSSINESTATVYMPTWNLITYTAKIDGLSNTINIRIGDTVTFTAGASGTGSATYKSTLTTSSVSGASLIGHNAIGFKFGGNSNLSSTVTSFQLTEANVKTYLVSGSYYTAGQAFTITTQRETTVYTVYINKQSPEAWGSTLSVTVNGESKNLTRVDDNQYKVAVAYGQTISIGNSILTRNGYTFNAWLRKDGSSFSPFTNSLSDGKYNATSDSQLYAKWTRNDVTITATATNPYYIGKAQSVASSNYVLATNDSASLQWQKYNGSTWTNVAGQTSDYLSLTNVSENGTYRIVVTVTGAFGTARDGENTTYYGEVTVAMKANSVVLSGSSLKSYYTGTSTFVEAAGNNYGTFRFNYTSSGETPNTTDSIIGVTRGTLTITGSDFNTGSKTIRVNFTASTTNYSNTYVDVIGEIVATPVTLTVSGKGLYINDNIVHTILTPKFSSTIITVGNGTDQFSFSAIVKTSSGAIGTYPSGTDKTIQHSGLKVVRNGVDIASTNFEILVSGTYSIIAATYTFNYSPARLNASNYMLSDTLTTSGLDYVLTITSVTLDGELITPTGAFYTYTNASGSPEFTITGNGTASLSISSSKTLTFSITATAPSGNDIFIGYEKVANGGTYSNLFGKTPSVTASVSLNANASYYALYTSLKQITINYSADASYLTGRLNSPIYASIGSNEITTPVRAGYELNQTWTSNSTNVSASTTLEKTTIVVKAGAYTTATITAGWTLETPELVEGSNKNYVGYTLDSLIDGTDSIVIARNTVLSSIANQGALGDITYSYQWKKGTTNLSADSNGGLKIVASIVNNATNYSLVVTASSQGVTKTATITFSITFNISEITFTVTPANLVYNRTDRKNDFSVNLTVTRGEATVNKTIALGSRVVTGDSVIAGHNFDMKMASTSMINAGDYDIGIVTDTNIFSPSKSTAKVTIDKAPITINNGFSKVYDENNIAFTSRDVTTDEGKFAGDTLTVSGIFDNANVGVNKTITLTFEGLSLSNYDVPESITGTITESSKTVTVTASKTSLPYGEITSSTPVSDFVSKLGLKTSDATVTISAVDVVKADYSTGKYLKYSIDAYTLNLTLSSINYTKEALSGKSVNLSITKIIITITNPTKIYDKTNVYPSRSLLLEEGMLAGDIVIISGTYDDFNVSSSRTVSLKLAGADSLNYSLASSSVSGTITASSEPVTVSATTSSFNYGEFTDSTTLAMFISKMGIKTLDDTVTITNITVESPTYSTGKFLIAYNSPYTLRLTLASGNYTESAMANKTIELTINKLPIQITALNLNKAYDGTTALLDNATFTITGKPNDIVSIDKSKAVYAQSTPATSILINGLSVIGDDADNYDVINLKTLTGTISVKTLSISDTSVKVYFQNSAIYQVSTYATIEGNNWGTINGTISGQNIAISKVIFTNLSVGIYNSLKVYITFDSGVEASNYSGYIVDGSEYYITVNGTAVGQIVAIPVTITVSGQAYIPSDLEELPNQKVNTVISSTVVAGNIFSYTATVTTKGGSAKTYQGNEDFIYTLVVKHNNSEVAVSNFDITIAGSFVISEVGSVGTEFVYQVGYINDTNQTITPGSENTISVSSVTSSKIISITWDGTTGNWTDGSNSITITGNGTSKINIVIAGSLTFNVSIVSSNPTQDYIFLGVLADNLDDISSAYDTYTSNNTSTQSLTKGDGKHYYAVYSKVKKITLKYNDGSKATADEDIFIAVGTNVSKPNATRESFILSSWASNDSHASATIGETNTTFIVTGGDYAKATLTAQWALAEIVAIQNKSNITSITKDAFFGDATINITRSDILSSIDNQVDDIQYTYSWIKGSQTWDTEDLTINAVISSNGEYALRITATAGTSTKTKDLTFIVTFTRATITFTLDKQSLTYNGKNQASDITATFTVNDSKQSKTVKIGDYLNDIGSNSFAFTITQDETTNSLLNAGNYTVGLIVNSDIYENCKTTVAVNIEKFKYEITELDNIYFSKVMGENDPELIATLTIRSGDEVIGNVNVTFKRLDASEVVGKYALTLASYEKSENFEISISADSVSNEWFEILPLNTSLYVELENKLTTVYCALVPTITIEYSNNNWTIYIKNGDKILASSSVKLYYKAENLESAPTLIEDEDIKRTAFDGFSIEWVNPATKNAGKFDFSFSGESTNQVYQGVTAFGENDFIYEVTKKDINIESITKTFDTTIVAITNRDVTTSEGKLEGDNLKVEGVFDNENYGLNKVITLTFSGSDNINYNLPSTISGSINKSDAKITVKGKDSFTYGELAKNDNLQEKLALTILVEGHSNASKYIKIIEVTINGIENGYSQGEFLKYKNGQYSVSISIQSENYTDLSTKTITFVVNKKSISVSSVSPITKTYDGNTNLGQVLWQFDGKMANDDIAIDDSLAVYSDENMGDSIVINNLKLIGQDAENYIVSNLETVTGSITPSRLTVTGYKFEGYYSGSSEFIKTDEFVAGEISFADKGISFNKIEIIDDTGKFNIGTYSSVKYYLNISQQLKNNFNNIVSDGGDYIILTNVAIASIIALPINVEVSGRVLHTSDLTPRVVRNYTVSNDFGVEGFTFEINIQTKVGTAGSYSGNDAFNYSIASVQKGDEEVNTNNFSIVNITGSFSIIDEGTEYNLKVGYWTGSAGLIKSIIDNSYADANYILKVVSVKLNGVELNDFNEHENDFDYSNENDAISIQGNGTSTLYVTAVGNFTFTIEISAQNSNSKLVFLGYLSNITVGQNININDKADINEFAGEIFVSAQAGVSLTKEFTVGSGDNGDIAAVYTDMKYINHKTGKFDGIDNYQFAPSLYSGNPDIAGLEDEGWEGFDFAGWKSESDGVSIKNDGGWIYTVNEGNYLVASITAQWNLASISVKQNKTVVTEKTKDAFFDGTNTFTIGLADILSSIDNRNDDYITYSYEWFRNDDAELLIAKSDALTLNALYSTRGNYFLRISASTENFGQTFIDLDFQVEIEKSTISFSLQSDTLIYNAENQADRVTVKFTVNGVEQSATIKLSDSRVILGNSASSSFNLTIKLNKVNSQIVNAGQYTIALLVDEDIYAQTSETATLEVQKYTYKITDKDNIRFSKEIYEQDPTLETRLYAINFANVTVKFTREQAENKEPGSYKIIFASYVEEGKAGEDNFDISIDEAFIENDWFTINKATTLYLNLENQLSHIYDGKVATKVEVEIQENNRWEIIVKTESDEVLASSNLTLYYVDITGRIEMTEEGMLQKAFDGVTFSITSTKDVNTYNISYQISEISSYTTISFIGSYSSEYQVTPKQIEVTVSKVFDTTTDIIDKNVKAEGILEGDTVTFSGSFDTAEADETGNKKVTLSMQGVDAKNYALPQTILGTITKSDASIQVEAGNTIFTYGDSATAELDLEALKNALNLSIIVTGHENGAQFVSVTRVEVVDGDYSNAGYLKYKDGYYIVNIILASNSYSQISGKTINISIIKRELRVSESTIISREYNGENDLPEVDWILEGNVDGDLIEIDAKDAYFDDIKIGERKVIGLKLVGDDSINYNFISDASGQISNLNITISIIQPKNFVDDSEANPEDGEISAIYDGTPESVITTINNAKKTRKGYVQTGFTFLKEDIATDVNIDNFNDLLNAILANGNNITLTAIWQIQSYQLNISGDENATVTILVGSDETESHNSEFNYFETIKLKIVANSGYKFVNASETNGNAVLHISGGNTRTKGEVSFVIESDTSIELDIADIIITVSVDANATDLISAQLLEGNVSAIDYKYNSQEAEQTIKSLLESRGLKVTEWTYDIVGWTSDRGTLNDESLKSLLGELDEDASLTFKPIWQGKTYTVKFDANEGQFDEDAQITIENLTFGQKIDGKFPIPTRPGWVYTWNTDNIGSGTEYNEGDILSTPAENNILTLYAIWSHGEARLTVKFGENISWIEIDGARYTSSEEQILQYRLVFGEEEKTIKVQPADGYDFSASLTNISDGEISRVENSITVSNLTVNSTLMITATPKEINLFITISHATAGDNVIDGKVIATTGSSATIIFTADSGYQFIEVAGAVEGLLFNGSGSITTNITTTKIANDTLTVVWSGFTDSANLTITASAMDNRIVFERSDTVDSIVVKRNGESTSINPNGDSYAGATTGDSLEVVVTLKYGYRTATLSISNANSDMNLSPLGSEQYDSVNRVYIYTFTIEGFTQNFNVSITSVTRQFNVSVSAKAPNGLNSDDVGSANSDKQTYNFGETVTLTATFNSPDDYIVSDWQVHEFSLMEFDGISFTRVGQSLKWTFVITEALKPYFDDDKELLITAIFQYSKTTMQISVGDKGTLNYSFGSTVGKIDAGTSETITVGMDDIFKLIISPLRGYSTKISIYNDGSELDQIAKWFTREDVDNEDGTQTINITLTMRNVGQLIDTINIEFEAKEASVNIRAGVRINRTTTYDTDYGGTVYYSDENGNKISENVNTEIEGVKFTVNTKTDVTIYLVAIIKENFRFTLEAKTKGLIINRIVKDGFTEQDGKLLFEILQVVGDVNIDAIFTAQESTLDIYFVRNGLRVDAGEINITTKENYRIVVSGNNSSYAQVSVLADAVIEMTVYTGFNYRFATRGASVSYTTNGNYTVQAGLVTKFIDYSRGYTESVTFTVSNLVRANSLVIDVVAQEYDLILYNTLDEKEVVGKIPGVVFGEKFSIGIQENDIVLSEEEFEFRGYFTREIGQGTQYINELGQPVKAWNETGYIWNNDRWVEQPGFDGKTFSLFAAWSFNKQRIYLDFIPDALKDTNKADKAKVSINDVVVSLNDSNSWTSVDNLLYAELLLGETIELKAYDFENFKFNHWEIYEILDEEHENLIRQVMGVDYIDDKDINISKLRIKAVYHVNINAVAYNVRTKQNESQCGEMEFWQTDSPDAPWSEGTQLEENYYDSQKYLTIVAREGDGYQFYGWYNNKTNSYLRDSHGIVKGVEGPNGTWAYTFTTLQTEPLSLRADFIGIEIGMLVNIDAFRVHGNIRRIYVNRDTYSYSAGREIDINIGDVISFELEVSNGYNVNFYTILGGERQDIEFSTNPGNRYMFTYKITGKELTTIVNAEHEKIFNLYLETEPMPVVYRFEVTIESNVNENEQVRVGTFDYQIDSGAWTPIDSETRIPTIYGKTIYIRVNLKSYYKVSGVYLNSRDNDITNAYSGGQIILSLAVLENFDVADIVKVIIDLKRVTWLDDDVRSNMLVGSGTKDNPFKIDSERDMAFLSYAIINRLDKDGLAYRTAYYKITSDLDFTGMFWVPLGVPSDKFGGTLDFGDYWLKGIEQLPDFTTNGHPTSYSGLIWYMEDDAKVIRAHSDITLALIISGSILLLIILLLILIIVVRKIKRKKIEDLSNS